MHHLDLNALRTPQYGWNEHAGLLFVDQPIGTGFSYGAAEDYCTSEECVSKDMYEVLQGFFDKHDDLRGAEFYVTGESYAVRRRATARPPPRPHAPVAVTPTRADTRLGHIQGHYVPAVASYISKQNKELQGGDSRHIDLKAIAIGNGLTDPLVQYSAYADYVLERGLISKAFRDTIDLAYYAVCAPALLACKDKGVGCVIGLETCQLAVVAPLVAAIEAKLGHVMNPYNVTGACEHPPLCYDFSAITAYMQLESTREALHVTGDHEWETCDAGVHVALTADWMRDLELVVPGLLADGVRVLVYAGEDDFICNYKGNEKWVHAMKWPGQAAYDAASKDPKPWVVNGAPAGTAIESGNLTFLRVFKAGHMVPMDQPEAALDMINRLVSGRSYADGAGAATFIGRRAGQRGAVASI